jgi:uncharacterized membrane protein YfcA
MRPQSHLRRVLSVLALSVPLAARLAIYLVAGVAAGIANGIAGGGSFITFPTMLALGVPQIQANVSSSVGVLPSYLGGLQGFRRELAARLPLIRRLLPACIIGTLVGTALLLQGSPGQFKAVVPWLIGGATLLFALAPLLTRKLAHVDHNHPTRRAALQSGVFLVALYGGYFGAGLGIMLLAVMGLTLPDDLDTLHGLRSALSTVINAVAAIVFIIRGHLNMEAVPMLLIGTLIGGWLGTKLIRRLRPSTVRALIVAIGAATAIRLWI